MTDSFILENEDGTFQVQKIEHTENSVTPQTVSSDGSDKEVSWRFEKSTDPNKPNSVFIKNNSRRTIRVVFPISYGWTCSASVLGDVVSGEGRWMTLPPQVTGICWPATSSFL